MADKQLSQILGQLKHSPSMSYPDANALLSKAKLSLLKLNALTPSPSTPKNLLPLARETYEQGALFAIRARNPEAFTRYVQQLQTQPVDAQRLDRIKSHLRYGYALGLDTPGGVADQAASAIAVSELSGPGS